MTLPPFGCRTWPLTYALPPIADLKWQFPTYRAECRFGAKNVRFTPESRHSAAQLKCLLRPMADTTVTGRRHSLQLDPDAAI
jgi:hypothetical protein